MFNRSLPLLVISLWGIAALPLPERASAVTPLTRAEIQNLRNLVQLIPRNKLKKRPAQKSDAMIPGDGLSTGRASLADLRFNDGSLARVGEQAIFQFLPRTRSFRLSNGTALLLIPPGRGQTRIQTPSAAAAIRGSALFVRYDQQTDTTVVGALTNSGIEVSNKEASQTKVLQAGQLMVIVKGKFQGLYDFDLRNFYETSDLVRGLDLNKQSATPNVDPAMASVQAETAAALQAQSPITGSGVVENPSFLELTSSSSNETTNNAVTNNSPIAPTADESPVNSFEETGQILSNTEQQTTGTNNTTVPNNNVSVDSSGTTTRPQNPTVQPPVVDSGTPTNPVGGGSGTPTDPVGGGSGTPTNPVGGGWGTPTNPVGGGSGTPTDPVGGGSGTPTDPVGGGSGTPTDPGDGGTGTPTDPGDGGTVTPTDPVGGGSGTPTDPGDGGTVTPTDPGDGGSGTPTDPGDGGSGTPTDPGDVPETT
ncbi:FecR domain-containing protein [Nostoc punctiforme FACHB-252]|uniref:FecR domain-containing protein n=1 Tax=Nostoc punctiforme FACHB-252 TaxID=1357509 RepID=A0ABR8HDN3_NOSPU|nr:FecR domain-containing protein [Nostoc punctiforme]MBD2613416.1 FecR domain-containing protein [Nostoc punctiforme FACHB-252]